MTVREYREKHGYWSEHPDHAVSDWQYEVANGDTKQGYWDWATAREDEGP